MLLESGGGAGGPGSGIAEGGGGGGVPALVGGVHVEVAGLVLARDQRSGQHQLPSRRQVAGRNRRRNIHTLFLL